MIARAQILKISMCRKVRIIFFFEKLQTCSVERPQNCCIQVGYINFFQNVTVRALHGSDFQPQFQPTP